MKKIYFVITVLFSVQQLAAQVPEDAIRMSWTIPSGTARNMAIGGAMGSLGGDFTATYVNPAGLGFYKVGEFVFTPGLSFLNSKGNYLGTNSGADKNTKFNIGATGLIFCNINPRSKWQNRTFSIGINRTANFNSTTNYRGANDFSSFSESFAEEFSKSGLPINTQLYSAPLSFGTKLANYTYLIDTTTVNGTVQVVGLPLRESLLTNGSTLLLQQKNMVTKGGITELSFATAANMNDKVYLGGSISIPIVNYQRTSTFTESDALNTIKNFNYTTYTENYKSQGAGINAKVGMIVKPAPNIRAGIAIHTPTLYGLRESTRGTMTTDLEGYVNGVRSANEDSIYTQNGVAVPEYSYDMVSPWHFLVSGSYVFNEVADVTRQRGFITADVEYVTHQSSRFHSTDNNADQSYYTSVNNAIKVIYKNAVNVKVGGELKFNTFATRLGFAYYGKPYDDPKLKAYLMTASGGIGYRNNGVFIDLTYVKNLSKDVDFPYRLADKANTFAEIRNRSGNIILTAGFKF